eukprot:CAMPEP_0113420872 /NCGR_PEP_ID=MMETSP0013_2-20120614/27573_1 /TAXON_ID=2843 ORGANISM="Skeletonema costatum, Strain 1716" /NCGR_SAMPLE_ID=MMETSP0013_2 /ASSEMBLY_ACC=CAM_ASM_000158 /LENGTH=371 /DNA_ID=CAMNT_0000308407 /DNA_START=460 /DNA_END=1571 /DNA_ORIENTATION=+ /assembly_acc=CAM_ASM_000158
MTKLTFQQIIPTPHSTTTTNANTASSSSTPLPRSSHGLSIIHNGSLLVLYGGEHIARTPIHDPSQVLWLAKRMNGTESWQWIVPTITTTNAAIMPPSRVAHAQAAVGNTIYIFGGRNGIEMGENAMNDMWMLTVHEDTTTTAKWTQINASSDDTTSVLPEARSFHKMIAIGSNLYMFGGCGASSGRLNDLWKFDTLTHKWTNLGVSHVLRGRGGPNILSLAHDKKIGIVGGFAGEETNDGHVYSISNDGGSWEEEGMKGLEEMRPRSVCCFASLPMVNKCVIFGGEVDPSQKGHEGAGGFERDVVILDGMSGSVLENIKPSGGNEDEEEEWPGNRGWADATVHEDTMYIFGGLAGDDASPIRLNDLWQCKV